MAELLKNELIARDFVVAALGNPNTIKNAQDINIVASNIVSLYKAILNLLNADKPPRGEVQVLRPVG